MVEQQGDLWSYFHCPRANIFRRDQGNVSSIAGMKHIMRENDYLHDPLSGGDPSHAISSRFDLETTFAYPFGAIDSKIVSHSLFQNLSCFAISGPTYQSLPPFAWTGNWSWVPHGGLPTTFQFDWVEFFREY